MRIIAGEFRGRRLLAPEGDETTRPVTDRVKQSVFDILAPQVPDAIVYDCFAGTGSMGLECLSRGAARCVFFEADRSASGRLRKNIQALGVTGRSQVVTTDLFHWFSTPPAGPALAPGLNPSMATLIFLDPPYRFLRERPDDLRRLAEQIARFHLADTGTLVFRHDVSDRLDLPELQRFDTRDYGGMTVELLRTAKPAPAAG